MCFKKKLYDPYILFIYGGFLQALAPAAVIGLRGSLAYTAFLYYYIYGKKEFWFSSSLLSSLIG